MAINEPIELTSFSRALHAILMRSAGSNIHYLYNYDKTVVYPYCVYDFQMMSAEDNTYPFAVTIDIFDYRQSFDRIRRQATRILHNLDNQAFMNSRFFFRIRFDQMQDIPTADESIKRGQVALSGKVFIRRSDSLPDAVHVQQIADFD